MKSISILFAIAVVFLGCSCVSVASATDNPINKNQKAPNTILFKVTTGECCGGEDADPHAVHGLETDNQAFILSGKSADVGGGRDGFVVRITDYRNAEGVLWLIPEEDFNYDWVYTFGSKGRDDGVNAAAQIEESVFVAGFRADNHGVIHSYLARLNLSDGNEIWSTMIPASKREKESAFEFIQTTSENGIVLSGVTNAEKGSLEGFKSYGNPATGTAFVMHFKERQLMNEDAPLKPDWMLEIPGNISAKTIKEVVSQEAYVVASSTTNDNHEASVIMIDKAGKTSWIKTYPSHGEVTDIAPSYFDGKVDGYLMVGHVEGKSGALDGSITKLSNDGSILWSKQYGNPSIDRSISSNIDRRNDRFIFDECWGIDSTGDGGAIIACGTGTHCDEVEDNQKLFDQCTSDPRGIWRSLLIRVDNDGKLLWDKTDSFELEDDGRAPNTASEYVFFARDGRIVSLLDLDFGFGLQILEPESIVP
tara:strand:- start:12958 stop:14391 length:1434 start_codon:yes stop_codon:yes gene_type:complete